MKVLFPLTFKYNTKQNIIGYILKWTVSPYSIALITNVMLVFCYKKYIVNNINTVTIISDDPLVDNCIVKGFKNHNINICTFSLWLIPLSNYYINIAAIMSNIINIILP